MDDNEDLNEVLDITQRQKRAMILRAHKTKIERARELAKRRMAPEKNIKKRAYAQARQIVRKRFAGARGAEYEKLGPSEKIAIDRAIEKKQALIKKIALRLIPRVKQAEQKRLHSFMKGQSLTNTGAPEGHKPVSEEFNSMFEQMIGDVRMSPKTDKEKKDSSEKKSKSPIIQYAKFGEESDNVSAVYQAIAKKAGKSGIDIDVLGEVYDRGMDAWSEDMPISQQQYAFARVNSFINKGKSYYTEDADLHENAWNQLGQNKPVGNTLPAPAKGSVPKHGRKFSEGDHVVPHTGPYAGQVHRVTSSRSGSVNIVRPNTPKYDSITVRAKHEHLSPATPEQTAKYKADREAEHKRMFGEDADLAESNNTPYVRPHIEKGSTKQSGWKASNKHGKVKYFGMDFKKSAMKHAGIEEEVMQSNENFMDGKGPGKPGDAARHGLKGKSATELKKIRSSETTSPRKKQLAHWMLNMHHNESVKEGLKDPEDNPCWKGYKPVGTKKLRGKTVPNCVPESIEEGYDVNSKHYKALTDLDLNTKNRDMTTKHDGYGPLNPMDTKGSKSFWEDKAKMWNTTVEAAMEARCRNCAAFNQAPAIMKKMAEGLGPAGEKIQDLANLGFCELFEFKCAGDRTCNKWLVNGPITEEDTGNGTRLVDKESKNSKLRKRIEKVDRAAPHTEHGKQQEIQKKIIDEEGNCEPDPKKRLIGTDSLVKAYKKDTPGQVSESLNEAFNIAYASGVGVTLTAADLGMKTQGGFALHPSVIEEMERRAAEEMEEEVRSADVKGVVVRTATGKTVVRKQKANRKIIGTGNLTDGKPDDTL